jgi:hypothetical protein
MGKSSETLDRHAASRLAMTTLWGLVCHAEALEASRFFVFPTYAKLSSNRRGWIERVLQILKQKLVEANVFIHWI